MNRKKIFLVLLILAVTVSLGACKKNRFCHCISESYQSIQNGDTNTVADTTVVNIDRGMKCENIYEMGVEVLKDGVPQVTTLKVNCTELDVDTVVTTIPIEHPSGD